MPIKVQGTCFDIQEWQAEIELPTYRIYLRGLFSLPKKDAIQLASKQQVSPWKEMTFKQGY